MSVYQFGTMADVVKAFEQQQFTFADFVQYQPWFHAEDIFDKEVHAEVGKDLDAEWHARFASTKNDDMSVTRPYLLKEFNADVCTAGDTSRQEGLEIDGNDFKKKYFADVQRMFSRVQHHMHRKLAEGMYP